MAISWRILASGTAAPAGGATWTTAAFTPNAGELVVAISSVVDGGVANVGNALTISDSQSTSYGAAKATLNTNGTFTAQGKWWAATPASSTSTTITFGSGGLSLTSAGWVVIGITGHDTSSPFGGLVSEQTSTTTGSYSMTGGLSVAPASGDVTFGWLYWDGSNTGTYSFTVGTAGTWTKELTLSNNSPGMAGALESRTGSTSTTVDYANRNSGTMTLFTAAAFGFVIKAVVNPSGTIAVAQANQTSSITGSNNTITKHNWWIPGATLSLGSYLLKYEPFGNYQGLLYNVLPRVDLWGGMSVPATDSLAATQDPNTASFTGTVTISGTIAATQGNNTMSASGTETISGTLASTQANQTSSFTGTETISGTIAATQADQTMSASGSSVVNPTGTIAATQADNTMSASGSETITGTIAATQADQTMTASGFGGVIGTIAASQADQTMSASGAETISGTIAVTQADQTMSATGTSGNSVIGTIAVAQADNTMSASGTETISGTIAATQAAQTMSASGTVTGAGTWASTQDPNTASFTGAVTISGTIAATQAANTSNLTGAVTITGSMSITQANQTMAASGNGNTVTGTLAGANQDNVFIGIGAETITGTLAANQASQTGVFLENLPAAPSGTMGTNGRRKRITQPKLPAVV